MNHDHPIRRFRDANKEHRRLCDFYCVAQIGDVSYVPWVLSQLKTKPFLLKWFTEIEENTND